MTKLPRQIWNELGTGSAGIIDGSQKVWKESDTSLRLLVQKKNKCIFSDVPSSAPSSFLLKLPNIQLVRLPPVEILSKKFMLC